MADIAVALPDVPAPPSGAPQSEASPDFRAFKATEDAAAIARHKGSPAQGKPPAPAASKPETSSVEGQKPEETTAPASETGKTTQEQPPKGSAAEKRIRDLVAKTKTLEAELAQLRQGKSDVKPESSPAPAKEQPKPAAKLEPPKKPQLSDFQGEDAWQQFEDAKDKYFEDLADYKAEMKLQGFREQQQQEALARDLSGKVNDVSSRYGEEARAAIGQAVEALVADDIPMDVRRAVNESPVLVDLLYAAANDPAGLDAFVELAKSNPLAAIKQVAVMEFQLQQGSKAKPAEQETTERQMPERGEDGKFVSSKPPEKPQTKAPAIGTEVSGRGSAPPDASAAAAKNGDFRSFRESENAKALERHRTGRR